MCELPSCVSSIRRILVAAVFEIFGQFRKGALNAVEATGEGLEPSNIQVNRTEGLQVMNASF